MRYGAMLFVFLLACGVSPVMAGSFLSDDEMDQVVAQGWKPDKSKSWNFRNRTTATQQIVQICAYAICAGPVANVSQISQDPSSIVIQTPWLVKFGPSVVTVPTVQVPSVSFTQNPIQTPSVNIQNSFIKIP